MKKSNYKIQLLMSSLLMLSTIGTASATKYALLVGISEYHIKPLSGPINDVSLMKSILNKKWSFKKENIQLLLNKNGTKKNILNAIKRLDAISRSGDDIFIYLSGHGTSALDKNFSSPLPTTSGAFIPIDIENIKNKDELVEHLIIGRDDLKPLLQNFDNNGKNVFVAIDACYSGNTVRGLYKKQKLNNRFLSFNDILPTLDNAYPKNKKKPKTRSFGDDLNTIDSNTNWRTASESNINIYPYKNIYYLSASGEFEPAQDIQPNMLERYPTIDGKPHGAFSDTLLRVLDNDINADIDQDGFITYSELKKTVRNKMRLRGFDHTPQGLPSLAEDKGKLASRNIFGHGDKKQITKKMVVKKPVLNKLTLLTNTNSTKPKFNKLKLTQLKLRIEIDKTLPKLKKLAKKINNIKIVSTRGQLEIRKKGDSVLFISHAGDLILSLYKPTTNRIIDKIRHQLWIKQLVEKPFKQDFNIDLDMFASGSGSTVVEGGIIGVAIKSSQTAHILVINIDPHGTINVLYPDSKSELIKLKAYKLLAFSELSKVIPPFGREYIQVYAFKNSSQDYRDLMSKKFNLNSPSAKILKRLLENEATIKARASLELVTTPGN